MQGRVIKHLEILPGTDRVPVSLLNQPNGLYFFSLQSGHVQQVKKVVVQK